MKMFKCILAVVLVTVLCLGFVACGGGETEETPKIGMIWYGNTDPMGGTFYAWANHAAEVLGVELIWKLGSYTVADELTDCENLISAGCKGIYFISMDPTGNVQIGNACKEAGVYFATSNRDILDPDILAQSEANPFYVLRIHDNSYDTCYKMCENMAAMGVTDACIMGSESTDAMASERYHGFLDGCKAFGIKVLAEAGITSNDANADVNTVNNFMTLYPNMNGLFVSSGTAGTGEAVMQALNASGKTPGSIKVAMFDTFAGNKEAFEAGWLAQNCGGYTSECLVSFISVVNAVRGNTISETGLKDASLTLSPLIISSAEEMDIFSQYVDNKDVQLYSDEIILSLVGPNVTAEDYQKVLDDWSIDFVKEAVGK